MIRKIFVATIGMTQVVIGTFSIFFTYLFNYNIYNVQALFNIPKENESLLILLFLIFGLFSLISGVSFIQEWRSYI